MGSYERVGVVIQTANTTVWKGFDPGLKREVALKQLRGHGAADAARREAKALAGLRHPNIVSVYDVLDDDGVWLVEQWVTGASLSAVLARTGKLRAIDALALMHGALSGLAYAHDRDVVHGDIAPTNVLIDEAGTAMLVDFGLSVSPGDRSIGGTPGYMAPEAAAGEHVDKRSDVYSTCVVLAELLLGARLFTGTALAVTRAQATAPQLPGIESPIAGVLTAGLDPRQDARPADAATLLSQLDEAAEQTYGKGWLALAGLGAIGSTAATIGTGVALSGAAGASSAAATAASAAGTAASAGGRGKLIAAGALGTAVVVGVAAFLLTRPDSATQTASTATTTTTTTTPPAPEPPPPPPAPTGPLLSGTYATVVTLGSATVNQVLTASSDCPACDATVSSGGVTRVFKWNGVGWEATSTGGCGPVTTLLTPVGGVDGVVQNLTVLGTYLNPSLCPLSASVATGTGTRTGG